MKDKKKGLTTTQDADYKYRLKVQIIKCIKSIIKS